MMERDFMGLNSKRPVCVKEEFVEGSREDSGFARSSGLPWLLENKMSLGYPSNIQLFPGRSPLPSEQWNNSSKSAIRPSQLTIFYGGSVSVFNDITPEMAQAIIFLAGRGVLSQPKVASATAVDHVPTLGDLQSPVSVSSHDGLIKAEPPIPTLKIMASASAMISAAVPQARKASLARFLQKRKERVMNSAPYTASKMSGCNSSPAISGAGSSSLSGKGIADDAY